MLFSFRDLKTGEYHEINMFQISEFSICSNEYGKKSYLIHMANGMIFTLAHKTWNKAKKQMRDMTITT